MQEIKMQKITPFLWFDNNAQEAVKFYTSVFRNSKILKIATYNKATRQVSGKKNGSVMTIAFKLNGQDFTALNCGPYFTFSPAVSFLVTCKNEYEILKLWEKLSEDGQIVMPLNIYQFSQVFGWVQDKFGVS